jgi:hypothetical protein
MHSVWFERFENLVLEKVKAQTEYAMTAELKPRGYHFQRGYVAALREALEIAKEVDTQQHG